MTAAFDEGRQTYRSDIILGERYRHERTGLEGHATSIHFYEHACERVLIEYRKNDGDIGTAAFDAPDLVHITTGEQARQQAKGGPDRGTAERALPTR